MKVAMGRRVYRQDGIYDWVIAWRLSEGIKTNLDGSPLEPSREEWLDAIKTMWREGLDDGQMGERLGCSRASVSDDRRELGLPPNVVRGRNLVAA